MHLADGVLSTEMAVATTVGAAGILAYSLYKTKEEEIPKISLMSAVFFTFAMFSLPLGPSSVHPLLTALLGIMLGRRAPIAVFIGLFIQAAVFQHGGITTLGVNTLLISLPALLCWQIFSRSYHREKSPYILSGALGGLGVVLTVMLLVAVLWATDIRYTQGVVSNIQLIIVSHIPLMFVEGGITAFAVGFIHKSRKTVLESVKG